VPIVVLARSGSVIPVAAVAQSTDQIDWDELELRVFSASGDPATGHVALPEGNVHEVKLSRNSDGKYELKQDPLKDDVRWRITNATGE
jgi:alpha-D-xyloside xylohydrolase